MTSQLPLSALVWNWYAGFVLSMGLVTAAAMSFALGLMFVDWLYQKAKKIESLPIPPDSYWQAQWNLTRFQAIVVGVLIAPVISVVSYYFLFFLVWEFAPAMVSTQESEPDAISLMLENSVAMASLVILAASLAAFCILGSFILLRRYAKRIKTDSTHVNFVSRLTRRYFQENVLVGGLLLLLAFPVMIYFFYNIALLALVISPLARYHLNQVVLPNADSLYMHIVTTLSPLLTFILFIPFVWLFVVRGGLLFGRYMKENAPMNLIFRRSAKFYLFSLLGFFGYVAMGFWAQFSFKLIVTMIAK